MRLDLLLISSVIGIGITGCAPAAATCDSAGNWLCAEAGMIPVCSLRWHRYGCHSFNDSGVYPACVEDGCSGLCPAETATCQAFMNLGGTYTGTLSSTQGTLDLTVTLPPTRGDFTATLVVSDGTRPQLKVKYLRYGELDTWALTEGNCSGSSTGILSATAGTRLAGLLNGDAFFGCTDSEATVNLIRQ